MGSRHALDGACTRRWADAGRTRRHSANRTSHEPLFCTQPRRLSTRLGARPAGSARRVDRAVGRARPQCALLDPAGWPTDPPTSSVCVPLNCAVHGGARDRVRYTSRVNWFTSAPDCPVRPFPLQLFLRESPAVGHDPAYGAIVRSQNRSAARISGMRALPAAGGGL